MNEELTELVGSFGKQLGALVPGRVFFEQVRKLNAHHGNARSTGDNEVNAVFERADVKRGGEGGVDQRFDAVAASDVGEPFEVEMTPIRPLRVAEAARRTAGRITSMTGTS